MGIPFPQEAAAEMAKVRVASELRPAKNCTAVAAFRISGDVLRFRERETAAVALVGLSEGM